jgi:hypothetical protein
MRGRKKKRKKRKKREGRASERFAYSVERGGIALINTIDFEGKLQGGEIQH